MLKNSKVLIGGLATAAAISFSGVALANGGSYNPVYSTPAPASTDNGAGLYLGGAAGYALTHWNNLEGNGIDQNYSVSSSNGFAGRLFAGYMFNKNFGLEAGWTYLPSSVKINSGGSELAKIKNWAADVDGVMVVPIQDQFGVFGKVGLGYLRSKETANLTVASTDHESAWNVTFGAGAYYDITPQIRATASWIRYNGSTKLDDEYQPNPDVFLVGLQYRFATDFFSGGSL